MDNLDKDLIDPAVSRLTVYEAVDTERKYQSEVISTDPNRCTPGVVKSVGDYLVMLQAYVNRADEVWISTVGKKATLDFVRKIAGIAVKCMEQHGAPNRVKAVPQVAEGATEVEDSSDGS